MAGPWEEYQQRGPWDEYKKPEASQSKQESPKQAEMPAAMQMLGNAAAGLVRGAGSIGATLLTPYDFLAGNTKSIGNPERRKAMDEAMGSLGFDTSSLGYGAGKLGGEIAGTAGVGGSLANGLARVAPSAAAAFPGMIQSIRTAGMTAGQPGAIGARVVGGALTGGASAGLVNPEDAAQGAVLGGGLPVAAKAAGYAGKKLAQGVSGAAKHTLGLSTGVGAEPVSQAFKAGREGNQAFLKNMRGEVAIDDVLAEAKSGLDKMRAAKSAQYRSGMIPISSDKSVLTFADIDKAFDEAAGVATYKGQVKNETAASAVDRMRKAVDDWRQLDPAEFHTPEGMDALKQKLGAIMESISPSERGARLAAGKVYNATKATIDKQAPTYAKVMRDYSQASEQITEIERALSLGDRASKDTAMRKLQSLMRNNVQTNYGNRLALASTLEQGGGVELMPSIAGQAMSSWTPRSLAGQVGGGATALMATQNPLIALGLPFQSPRMMGEAAYGLGGLLGKTNKALSPISGGLLNPALGAPDELLHGLYRAAPVVGASL